MTDTILDIEPFEGLPINWKEIKARREAESRACATLKDPENDIRDLVRAASTVLRDCKIFCNNSADIDDYATEDLRSALSKFEGVK